MLARLYERRSTLADESGFTLIELLVVLINIGVLLAIAIPSYLGFQRKAQQTAAMSDVRAAVPDAKAYYSDFGAYVDSADPTRDMSAQYLHDNYDSGLAVSDGTSTGIVTAAAVTGDDQSFCISAVDSGHWAHFDGPGGQVVNDDNDAGGAATADPCAGP
jgi:type IV pilus assembly protein PilA